MTHHDGPLLDRQIGALNRQGPSRWGVQVWLGPVLTLACLIVALQVVAHHVHLHGSSGTAISAFVGIAGDLVLLAAMAFFGRTVAARTADRCRTFGLAAPSGADVLPWLAGIGVAFVAKIVIGGVANGMTHGRATQEAANLHVHDVSRFSLWTLVVAVAVVAPVVEELMFRGMLLRAFMRRMPFWPAAWLSSITFALFHTYEVRSVAGAVTLAASVGSMGLVNCVLVRITGRLTPGILVHASFNLLAVVVLAYQAKH